VLCKMRLSVVVFVCLSSYAASYTPRMFRPGGKYYTPPKNAGGIDDQTRAQLSGILNGILTNLQKHKAALPQVAQDIVTQYHLTEKDTGLVEGMRAMYENLSEEMVFNSADEDVQSKTKVVLASVLQKVDSSYTPRMFAPGGKYYKTPDFGRRNTISKATRDEVGNILKGILGNLMKHKAALTQAKELVKQFSLDGKSDEAVTEGLRDAYDRLQTPAHSFASRGLKQLLKDEKAFDDAAERSQASAVLALVIEQADATYVPGQYRPHKYSGYTPSRSRGLGISKGTRDQVAGILKGILENLTKHKAALSQLADDVTKQYQGNTEVAEGLQAAFEDLANQKELAGASSEVQIKVKSVLASVLTKVTKH